MEGDCWRKILRKTLEEDCWRKIIAKRQLRNDNWKRTGQEKIIDKRLLDRQLEKSVVKSEWKKVKRNKR